MYVLVNWKWSIINLEWLLSWLLHKWRERSSSAQKITLPFALMMTGQEMMTWELIWNVGKVIFQAQGVTDNWPMSPPFYNSVQIYNNLLSRRAPLSSASVYLLWTWTGGFKIWETWRQSYLTCISTNVLLKITYPLLWSWNYFTHSIVLWY